MAPFIVPSILEPELSAVGKEKLELRLQEWQAQQDLQKWKKTQHRLHQRNLELREQLDTMYEEKHRDEQYHKQQLGHLSMTTVPQPVQLDLYSHSFTPLTHIPTPVFSQPLPCLSHSITRSKLNPVSEVPVVVLPIFPVPEQFQSYDHYLGAYYFWLSWHCVTAPGSLDKFNIFQTVN